MFLKSMELMGFKSFADRTHIDFAEGISALLGPNGCGKSNIVDGVKWVLGEQSTRNMRAMKMEDVIFNGTEKRKPLNVAEVTLTLSNENNILDMDVPEIAVKRRLYRSGESEYFINNAPVRLKELRELFLDTGVGKTAYSILEQGKIDQILSNKPEERRYLFEEAAGITKYKLKAQEAGRKMERTRDNIKQASNILTEVSRSYFTLKEQAEKTEEYRRLKEEIFQVEVDLQLLKLINLKEMYQRRNRDHEEKQKKVLVLQEEINTINGVIKENSALVSSMEEKLSDNQKKIYGIEIEKENFESRKKSIKEREEEVLLKAKSLLKKKEEILKRIQELKDSVTEKKAAEKEFLRSKEEREASLKTHQELLDINQKKTEENKKLNSESRKNIEEAEEKREEIISELRELSCRIVNRLEEGLKDFSFTQREELKDAFIASIEEGAGQEELKKRFTEFADCFPGFLEDLFTGDQGMEEKASLDKHLSDCEKIIAEERAFIHKRQEENTLLEGELKKSREASEELKVKIAETAVKLQGLEDSVKLLDKHRNEEEEVLKELEKEKLSNEEKVQELKKEEEELMASNKKLVKEEEILKGELSEIEKSISQNRKLYMDKAQALNRKKESLNKMTLQIEKFSFEAEHLTGQIDTLCENFQEKYSRDILEFEERTDKIETSQSELKEKLAIIRHQQKMLGQINLMAPEEFKEVRERYDFLNNQIKDLKEADENLNRVTREIKEESTRLFLENFNLIKNSFQVMYKRLFGGGRAELKLSDPKEVLESGIEIYAQPPGKNLENISLLSGGERSLTAVALLFATYEIKPSPFCILDEIDAALDERSINRFISTLAEFSENSQFIVITHNKKTVTGAGALLGVTMEESGVSKLITMRLEEKDD